MVVDDVILLVTAVVSCTGRSSIGVKSTSSNSSGSSSR